MNYKEEFNKWLSNNEAVSDFGKELNEMKDDEAKIKSAFGSCLEFGTAGLRGIIGAGTNRMNKFVVRRATQGIADYIIKSGDENKKRGVVIAYDSRNFSKEFALETALVFCANGIKVYLFDELRPVPELSFTVRHKKAIAGIAITASHNPSEYNGYKAYWEDGGQLPPTVSDKVLEFINARDTFEYTIISKEEAEKSGLLNIIGKETDECYIDAVYKQAINKDAVERVADSFKLIYTPIHGSGNKPVRMILKKIGFKNVLIVKEQELPDGNFPTVTAPNPENKECFNIAIKMAKENNVDLIIGTDPDSDRMGIVLLNKQGEYVTMTGNQVGAMITYYILKAKQERGTLPKNGAVISTIVSTKMTKAICDYFGVKFIEVLTGFKFIGEQILNFEKTGSNEFLFGFEESYGYLAGTHARDKDGVVASMLIAEMAAYYSEKNMTLYDAMEEMYEKFGGFAEETVAITMKGDDGLEKIKAIMDNLRNNTPEKFGDYKVTALRDYNIGKRFDFANKTEENLTLPKSNVLYFELSNGVCFVARPSGTEPKIKMYYLSQGKDYNEANDLLIKTKEAVNSFLNS